MARYYSIIWIDHICLSFHPLIGLWVISTFCILWANWPLKCILHSTLRLVFLKCNSHHVTSLIECHLWFFIASRISFKLLSSDVGGNCLARSEHLSWGRNGEGTVLSWAWSPPTLMQSSLIAAASCKLLFPFHHPRLSNLYCPCGPQHLLLCLGRKMLLHVSHFFCCSGNPLRSGIKYDS